MIILLNVLKWVIYTLVVASWYLTYYLTILLQAKLQNTSSSFQTHSTGHTPMRKENETLRGRLDDLSRFILLFYFYLSNLYYCGFLETCQICKEFTEKINKQVWTMKWPNGYIIIILITVWIYQMKCGYLYTVCS